MTFVIGLTGSMGMGKSTTAQMFRDESIPVWDADKVVHKLYAIGGQAVKAIAELHPDALKNGAVDRGALKDWIKVDKSALSQIEDIVHPLLAQDRAEFLAQTVSCIAVLDFPLLFETGAENLVDCVLVVSVPERIQKQRILARNTMDSVMLDTILAAQMPDQEKRERADVVIKTVNLEATRLAVQNLIKAIREGRYDA